MRLSRIQIAKPDIVSFFETESKNVLKYKEIASILSSNRNFWRLAQSTSTQAFIKFLIESSKLKKFDFNFPYRPEPRYVWGDIPLLEVLLTIKKNSYFTHYTAMRMHGLTEQIPKTIYINHEQPARPQNSHLEQKSIDAAFRNNPRVSKNFIELGSNRICMVNGMQTNQLGVIDEKVNYDNDSLIKVRVTNLERTLIDIAVRPVYSGGIAEVQKAYSLAKENVSINSLAAMLPKLKYVYPYHQAIGYYLERAGYRSNLLDLLRRFPIEHDFYITHQIKEKKYIKEWRLFVPEGF